MFSSLTPIYLHSFSIPVSENLFLMACKRNIQKLTKIAHLSMTPNTVVLICFFMMSPINSKLSSFFVMSSGAILLLVCYCSSFVHQLQFISPAMYCTINWKQPSNNLEDSTDRGILIFRRGYNCPMLFLSFCYLPLGFSFFSSPSQ